MFLVLKSKNMKYFISFFLILLSFICNANPPTDTIKLNSVEIYFLAWSCNLQCRSIEPEDELIKRVLNEHSIISVVRDTIFDSKRLLEFDSVCRQNVCIKSEIFDSVNIVKSKYGWASNFRLVYVLNYNNKKITIGFGSNSGDIIALHYIWYKIKKESHKYFIDFLYEGRNLKTCEEMAKEHKEYIKNRKKK